MIEIDLFESVYIGIASSIGLLSACYVFYQSYRNQQEIIKQEQQINVNIKPLSKERD